MSEQKEVYQTALHLLDNITIIRNKYDEIAKITGENFNIFKILGLTTNEVRTHSAFLAELLNPKGNHGLGELFLKLFVKQLNVEFDIENAIVEVEKHTGFINRENVEGGYIDIIVSNKKSAIIIENKIYAGDQWRQLERYTNYANKNFISPSHLFYLTLNGKDVSENSDGKMQSGIHYVPISYEKDMLEWLDLCKKEASNYPILRETITQYINLIKHLTNQSTNNKMEKELIEQIIKSKDNLESALLVSGSINEIKNAVVQQFITKIKNKLSPNDVEIEFKHIEMMYFEINFKNNFGFYLAIDFNEGFGISSRVPSLITQKNRNIISDKLSFLNKSNVSTESKYHNWIWFTRDWMKFDIEKLYNLDTITEECKILIEIMNALKDLEINSNV